MAKLCKCRICIRHRGIERVLKTRSLVKMRDALAKLLDELIHAEFELECQKSQRGGA